jgi:general secretion pathway protein L
MANSSIGLKIHLALRSFFAWWIHELASVIPVAWRHWYFDRGHILLVEVRDEQFLVHRPAVHGLEALGSVDLTQLSIEERKQAVAKLLLQATGGKSYLIFLCLSVERALRKRLRLPLAVEENLRQTLTFELDRQTPFKPEQVYFDCIVRERRPAEQKLIVELIVLPKDAVDAPVAQAAALGLSLNGAVLASDALELGARSPNFLSATTPNRRFRQRLWVNAALLLFTLILGGAAIILPLWQKRSTAIAMQGLVVEAKAAAMQTQSLRDQMETKANEYKFPVDLKNSQPSPFLLLNQLSKLLPDDTYISNLEITGRDVQIQGETGSSSKLIELMENSGFLKEASHKSSLTQIPGTTVERFHIAAKALSFLEQSDPKASPAAPVAGAALAPTPTPLVTGGVPPSVPKTAEARSATTRGAK